jgi:hypothetical protein
VVQVHNASGERKTAENLYRELEKVIDEREDEWKIVIVAVCSDAGGEALKGHKMAVRARPHLVRPDCFAHQVNQISCTVSIAYIFSIYRPTSL